MWKRGRHLFLESYPKTRYAFDIKENILPRHGSFLDIVQMAAERIAPAIRDQEGLQGISAIPDSHPARFQAVAGESISRGTLITADALGLIRPVREITDVPIGRAAGPMRPGTVGEIVRGTAYTHYEERIAYGRAERMLNRRQEMMAPQPIGPTFEPTKPQPTTPINKPKRKLEV